MELVKGVVEGINVKEAQDGQFGRSAGYGIKVGGAWYNGYVKEDQYGKCVVKDKAYTEIKQGMTVEFLLVDKNGRKSIDNKTLSVAGSQAAVPVQQAQQPVQQSAPKQPSYAAASIWLTAAQVAAQMATGMKFEVEGEPVKFATDKVIQMADVLFEKANSK